MSKQKLLLSSKTHFFPATSWLPIFICSSVLKILVLCSLIVLFFCCLFCSINNMPRCSLGDQIFIFTNCPLSKTSFHDCNFANIVIPPWIFLTNILFCPTSNLLCCSEKAYFQNSPEFFRTSLCSIIWTW